MLLSQLKNNLIAVILIVIFTIIFSGCAHSKVPSSPNEEKTSVLPELNEISFLEVASEYFIEGKSALRRGDFPIALRYFETALMLDTNSEFLYNMVIETAVAAANPASAVNAIRRGRDYSQITDEDLRKIGSIYVRFDSYEQAFEAIDAVKEKTKNDTLFLMRLSIAENLIMIGALYNSQENYDSALIALNRVVEMGIKPPEILFEIGMANERKGNYEVAEKYFKEILLTKPKPSVFALTANYLGYMWADSDTNLVEAEALILMALKEEPENGAYLDSYGWVLFRLGRYQEALIQLLAAEEQIKDDYVMYYHLGEIYLKLDDNEKALENFKKANSFENNPDFEKIAEIISTLSE